MSARRGPGTRGRGRRAGPATRRTASEDAEARATRQSTESYVRELASRQPDAKQVETVVAVGEAADALVVEIGVRQPDLIAMSTHGRGGMTRLLMGSVATGVVQRTCAPVLLARPAEGRQEEAATAATAAG